jgi:hypothetical protein
MSQSDDILDVLRIEIHHANGTEVLDPNGVTIAMVSNPPAHRTWKPTDRVSIISGEPAILYKTHEVELALTPDETYRLVMRCLTRDEFRSLHKQVGSFFEIHGDFYDPQDGTALQPKA